MDVGRREPAAAAMRRSRSRRRGGDDLPPVGKRMGDLLLGPTVG